MARGRRHTPLRTCVACRTVCDKRELVRVVRTPDGCVSVDLTAKMNGRGAYLCRRPECVRTAARKHAIERHLQVTIPADLYAAIEQAIGADTLS